MSISHREWKFQALTDIWTGDADQRGERLIPTSLLGSIRWWFEVLIRGLDGSACDPSFEDRRARPESSRCPDPHVKIPFNQAHHCIVCELFGCTGWARKFRLQVLDQAGATIRERIKRNQQFVLRFVPLRQIKSEEWALLDLTLRLIADYGAISGRTVLKPSDEPGLADFGLDDFEETESQVVLKNSRRGLPLQRGDIILEIEGYPISALDDLKTAVLGKPHGEEIQVQLCRQSEKRTVTAWAGKRHHADYGLIQLMAPTSTEERLSKEQLWTYVQWSRWRRVEDNDFAWASLKNFWCVNGLYIAREGEKNSTFNRVIGRPEPKGEASDPNFDSWLAGRRPEREAERPPESKKVVSFKKPARTFGFVENSRNLADFRNTLQQHLQHKWGKFEFLSGSQILAFLTAAGGGR